MDLDSVADELYGADPEDFLRLRTERAAQARQAGDRPLAKQIGQLRKPVRSAWLVNLLARESATELQLLLDLGDALREAQATLSGPELRRLSAERHKVVEALTRQAAEIGRGRGHPTSDAVRQEVAQTLQAALADPDTAAAVRAGRVAAVQAYGGFGMVQPATAPAAAAAEPPHEAQEDPEAQKQLQAVQDLAEARRASKSAQNLSATARDDAERSESELARRRQETATLREQLAQAEAAEAEAVERAERSRRELEAAEAAEKAAGAAVKKATGRLQELTSPD
jgi:hypothetical protein